MKENIVWRQGDSQEKYQALVKEYLAFAQSAQPGDEAVLPVAICPTTRVVCDGVDRVIMLPCKAVQGQWAPEDRPVRICVLPPRYPQGIHPGVSVGMPLLACHDMEPMPPGRRVRGRSYRRRW